MLSIAFCFFLASGLSAVSAEPTPGSEPIETRLAKVADYLNAQREAEGIPGLSAAVVLHRQMVWSGGFGKADVENNVPATGRSVYRIGSITKMLTAVSALQLVESGRISLHESIREYVPELPDVGVTVHLRHVLAHMSGLRTFRSPDEYWNRREYSRLADSLKAFQDGAFSARPGEKFINSSFGYNVVGVLVERLSEKPFGDCFRERVIVPAGMISSGLDDGTRIVANRAGGYRKREGVLENSPFVDLSGRFPGDGGLSSAEDLARFAIAFQTNKLLSPELVQVMTTVHKTTSGTDEQYGLGCFVRTEGGRRIVGHGGWVPGASAFLVILPDQEAAVVILANLEQVDVAAMSVRVTALMLD